MPLELEIQPKHQQTSFQPQKLTNKAFNQTEGPAWDVKHKSQEFFIQFLIQIVSEKQF